MFFQKALIQDDQLRLISYRRDRDACVEQLFETLEPTLARHMLGSRSGLLMFLLTLSLSLSLLQAFHHFPRQAAAMCNSLCISHLRTYSSEPALIFRLNILHRIHISKCSCYIMISKVCEAYTLLLQLGTVMRAAQRLECGVSSVIMLI